MKRRNLAAILGVFACSLILAFGVVSVQAGPKQTLVVDDDDPKADYSEIYAAVAAAEEGDKIVVHPGTYRWFEVTTDNLTIEAAKGKGKGKKKGKGKTRPIVDAADSHGAWMLPFTDDSTTTMEFHSFFAIHVAADGVTVKGLEARNSTAGHDQAYGFLVTGDNNTLKDNAAIDNAHGFGLFGGKVAGFDPNEGPMIVPGDYATGNTLKDNDAEGNGVAGFEVAFAAANTLEKNTAVDGGAGIVVGFGDDNVLEKNSTCSNFRGIFTIFSSGLSLKHNTSDDNASQGILIQFGSGLDLSKNKASGNGHVGIYLFGVAGSTVKDNKAKENSANGFQFRGSTENDVEKNKSEDNGGYGYAVDETSEDNEFDKNKCKGNDLGGSNAEGVCD
jgi:parallel beta-helix repeat protein